jgi:hypothetical protein
MRSMTLVLLSAILCITVCCAQQSHPFNYSVVFDTAQPIDGHKVVDIDAVDIDEQGNIAALAICPDGTGIWSSKAHRWIAFTGQIITAAHGDKVTIDSLSQMALSPEGAVLYKANYKVIVDPARQIFEPRTGFFSGTTAIYEVGAASGSPSNVFYAPGNNVVWVMNSPSGLRLVQGNMGNLGSKPTDLSPPPAHIYNITNVSVNRTTGHYAYFATLQFGDRLTYGLTLVDKTAPLKDIPNVNGPYPLILNGHDDVAFSSDQNVYINGGVSIYKGKFMGFNDGKDILLEHEDTPVQEPLDRITINNVDVIQQGNIHRQGKVYLGLPAIQGRGFLSTFKYPRMNNGRQVAFAAQFEPVGAHETIVTLANRATPTINGVPIAWNVVVATPTK